MYEIYFYKLTKKFQIDGLFPMTVKANNIRCKSVVYFVPKTF